MPLSSKRGVVLRSSWFARTLRLQNVSLAAICTRPPRMGAALQVDPGNTVVAERLTQLKPWTMSLAQGLRPQSPAFLGYNREPETQLGPAGRYPTVYEQWRASFGIKVTSIRTSMLERAPARR